MSQKLPSDVSRRDNKTERNILRVSLKKLSHQLHN